MTNEDILTLAKAGFNAQQIAALSKVEQPVPTVQYPIQTAQQPVPTVQYPIQTAQQPVPTMQPLDSMSQQIAALTQAVQANAILSSSQPKAQTSDDVLAEIINPPSIVSAQNGGKK